MDRARWISHEPNIEIYLPKEYTLVEMKTHQIFFPRAWLCESRDFWQKHLGYILCISIIPILRFFFFPQRTCIRTYIKRNCCILPRLWCNFLLFLFPFFIFSLHFSFSHSNPPLKYFFIMYIPAGNISYRFNLWFVTNFYILELKTSFSSADNLKLSSLQHQKFLWKKCVFFLRKNYLQLCYMYNVHSASYIFNLIVLYV